MPEQTVRQQEGRNLTDLRNLQFQPGFNRYAEGSVLIKAGNTHVLVTASVEESVPGWLKGQGQGWITAEYSMLPRATHTRTKRDREKISGRTQEIQRLIGRALRAMVDLKALGERSIMVDCDVLQADGGTRTASITGACVAVQIALKKLISAEKIPASVLIDTVAAVSIGIQKSEIFVDLNYEEDSACDVDMNFVMTGRGQLVEVQGTAERGTFTPDQLIAMMAAAGSACKKITPAQKATLEA